MFLAYPLLLGLAIGLLRGGSPGRLAETRLRHGWLFFVVLLVQVLALSPGPAAAGWSPQWKSAVWIASLAVAEAGLLLNLAQPGFALLALGAGLNLVAIVANGGRMPAPAEHLALLYGPDYPAAVAAGRVATSSSLAGPSTVFPWLIDLFVLPPWLPFASVFSIGDVLIGLGAFVWLQVVLCRPAPAGRVGDQTP